MKESKTINSESAARHSDFSKMLHSTYWVSLSVLFSDPSHSWVLTQDTISMRAEIFLKRTHMIVSKRSRIKSPDIWVLSSPICREKGWLFYSPRYYGMKMRVASSYLSSTDGKPTLATFWKWDNNQVCKESRSWRGKASYHRLEQFPCCLCGPHLGIWSVSHLSATGTAIAIPPGNGQPRKTHYS